MAGNTSMNVPEDARLPDPMDFERLLRREMAIAPSAEFLPRVRERLSVESSPAQWGWRWLFPAGAAAAACTAILVLSVLSSDRASVAVPPPAPSLAVAQPIRVFEPPAMEARTLPTHDEATSSPAVAFRVATATPPSEAPVIVDEGQRAALAILMGVIRDGKLTDASFAKTTPVSLGAIRDGVVPLEVVPVTVSPIGGDGVLQKER